MGFNSGFKGLTDFFFPPAWSPYQLFITTKLSECLRKGSNIQGQKCPLFVVSICNLFFSSYRNPIHEKRAIEFCFILVCEVVWFFFVMIVLHWHLWCVQSPLMHYFYFSHQDVLARGNPKQRTCLIPSADAIVACTFWRGSLYYRSSQTYHYRFRVCKSVHHHNFNWINQQDAATSQVYYLSFRYSSTCFGHPHAHHQELQQLQ